VAFIFNGTGTTYYGIRYLPDGTYVTTKWIVLFFVPIFPVGSFHIISASSRYGSAPLRGQSMTIETVSLEKMMVAKIYGCLVAAVVGSVIVLPALGRWVGL
jgi:hypothetical protein